MMTAEGMVLFEAEAAPTLKLIRSLPPFDSRDFAQNMIEDIRLIFLAPEGKITTKGSLSDGAEICRWQTKKRRGVHRCRLPDSRSHSRSTDTQLPAIGSAGSN